MPIHLDQMTGSELQAVDKSRAAVFLVVSGLEDHGPHLPMNADLLEAEALAARVAELVEAQPDGFRVCFYPVAAMALDLTTSRFAVKVRGHVIRDYLIDVCDSLHEMGFRHFVCFTGSYAPRHLTAIEEAGQWLRRKHRKLIFKRSQMPSLVSASAIPLDELTASESSLWMNPREHGGARDTGMLLGISPESVRPVYRELLPLERASAGFSRLLEKRKRKIEGYWGSPADGKGEAGRAWLEERAQAIHAKLRAVWSGANPLATFKSWYSIFPMNRTVFPIWILFTVLIVLAVLWLGALLQTISDRALL